MTPLADIAARLAAAGRSGDRAEVRKLAAELDRELERREEVSRDD